MNRMEEKMNSIEMKTDLVKYRKRVERLISDLKERISTCPEGSLRITSHCHSHQYFHREKSRDTCGIYIPKKDRSLAVALAQKDYDIKLLAVLERQSRAIDRFLKNFDPGALQKVYENLIEPRKQLVEPVFLSDEQYIEKWLSEPYEKMGFGNDEPEYYTDRGERVRSKSEIIIANALNKHGIPYRYEFPVSENGVLMARPDFNCLNVRLRKDYYWEHLGMMGNERYAGHNVKKLERYTLSNEFDESRLILTFETEKHPLNTKTVELKIRRFLL